MSGDTNTAGMTIGTPIATPFPAVVRKPGQAQRAAQIATATPFRVVVPGLGALPVVPRQDLALLGGLGVLAIVGILEWPVAGVLAIGHLLAKSHSHELLRTFGEALEEA